MFRAHAPQPSDSHPDEDVKIWVKIREKNICIRKCLLKIMFMGGMVEMRGIFESGKHL